VVSVDPQRTGSPSKEDGQQVTYDPERLSGITAYREISRDFAQGDRIQFTSTTANWASPTAIWEPSTGSTASRST
jgi:hypothetical protein